MCACLECIYLSPPHPGGRDCLHEDYPFDDGDAEETYACPGFLTLADAQMQDAELAGD